MELHRYPEGLREHLLGLEDVEADLEDAVPLGFIPRVLRTRHQILAGALVVVLVHQRQNVLYEVKLEEQVDGGDPLGRVGKFCK